MHNPLTLFCFAFILPVGVAVTVACTKQQGDQVIATFPDAAKCIADVAEDATGVINIGQTIADCGVTVEQLIAIYSAKLDALDGGVADGAVGMSPKEARLRAMLAAAQAYKATHPNTGH